MNTLEITSTRENTLLDLLERQYRPSLRKEGIRLVLHRRPPQIRFKATYAFLITLAVAGPVLSHYLIKSIDYVVSWVRNRERDKPLVKLTVKHAGKTHEYILPRDVAKAKQHLRRLGKS